jgi:hypothetical protein
VEPGLDDLIEGLESRSLTWLSAPVRGDGHLTVVAGRGRSSVFVFPDTPENLQRLLDTAARLKVRVPDLREDEDL